MTRLQSPPTTEVLVTVRGEVSPAAPEYARAKLRAVLDRLDEPVHAARVKLTQEAHHTVARPSMAQAVIDLGGPPFVFFTDIATGRGNLLYHRYDGHYGLITPADQ